MLSSVKIGHCLRSHGEPFGSQNRYSAHLHRHVLPKAFPFVHTLIMGVCLNIDYDSAPPTPTPLIARALNLPVEFRDLRTVFPNLRALYIDVPDEVCASSVRTAYTKSHVAYQTDP